MKSKKKITKKKRVRTRKRKGKNRKKHQEKQFLIDILLATSCTIFLFIIILSFFISIQTFNGISMKPTIENKEKLLVSKHNKTINRFDIIGFNIGKKQEFRRVIGLPGERIRFKDDYLYVNEEVVDEKFLIDQINEYNKVGEIFTQSNQGENGFQVLSIPDDYYLVLGDNRPDATDSRHYWLIAKKQIKGVAIYTLDTFKKLD